MTHDEAYNQIASAMKYLSTSLADKDGVINATIRVKFLRDPQTQELTRCACEQSFQIHSA